MTLIKPTAAETEIQRVDFGLGDVQTDVASLARPILEESDESGCDQRSTETSSGGGEALK